MEDRLAVDLDLTGVLGAVRVLTGDTKGSAYIVVSEQEKRRQTAYLEIDTRFELLGFLFAADTVESDSHCENEKGEEEGKNVGQRAPFDFGSGVGDALGDHGRQWASHGVTVM